jgi:hypothetical protein
MPTCKKRGYGRRKGTRRQRGGYSSASSYGTFVNGSSINHQFRDTFGLNHYGNTSNVIVGAEHQNSGLTGQPNMSNLSLVQSAGRKCNKKHKHGPHCRHGTRGKRGGFFPIISQAASPAILLALQQTYKKNSKNPYDRRR